MPAIWRTPKSWSVGEVVTATQLNEQLRDNLEFLKTPPTSYRRLAETSDYSTTSTSWVDIDASKLGHTLVTAGGDVLVCFTGTIDAAHAGADSRASYFDVLVDDAYRVGGDAGLLCVEREPSNDRRLLPLVLCVLVRDLPPGTHNFKLQWRLTYSGGSAITLYAGGSAGELQLHPQFWVREV